MIAFLFLFSVNPVCAVDSGYDNLFFKANSLYFNDEFEAAVKAYESISKNYKPGLLFYPESFGDLFYNIGNCYFRLGQKGKALLNYERARLFMPRDADLKYNIEYLQDRIEDKVPQKENIISDIFGVNFFSRTELAVIFCTVNFFLFLFLSVRIFLKAEWTFYLVNIFLIFWIVSGISFGIMLKETILDNRVVILEKEVNVLAGPDQDDTLLFKVHEGTIAYHERNESGFSLIRLPDGKRGWLVSSAIEAVMPATN
jgi:hypothetical protein